MATAEDKSDVIQHRKGSLAAYKGHLKRAIRSVEAQLTFVESIQDPDALSLADLSNKLDKVQEQFDKVCGVLLELQELDDDHFDEYATQLDSFQDHFDGLSIQVQQALHKAKAAPASSLTQQPASVQGPLTQRVNDALKPPQLSLDTTPTELRSWISKWRAFYTTSHLDRQSLDVQQQYFLNFLDADLHLRLSAILDPAMPIFGDAGSCISHLREEFSRKYPLFTRRLEFFQFKQVTGQSFTDFKLKLQQKGLEADLSSLSVDELLTFRLISGTSDKALLTKFLRLEDPSLADIENTARAYEAANIALLGLSGPAKAAAVSKGTRPKASVTLKDMKGRCLACGDRNHKFSECTKREKLFCEKCKKKFHSASVCLGGAHPWSRRSRSRAQSRRSSRSPPASPNSRQKPKDKPEKNADTSKAASVRVNAVQHKNIPTPLIQLAFLQGKARFTFSCLPDTGCSSSIFGLSVVKSHKLKINTSSKGNLVAANGSQMACSGSVQVQATYKGRTTTLNALVSPALDNEVLISWFDLISLGVIPSDFPNPVATACTVQDLLLQRIDKLKEDFSDVFATTLGSRVMDTSPISIKLRTDKDVVPLKTLTARTIPRNLQAPADAAVHRMVNEQVIEAVSHVTKWISPGHFVPKPNGDARLVVDFTKINEIVQRPVHPFLTGQEILQSLEPDSTYFAVLDMLSGYHQSPLDSTDVADAESGDSSADLTCFLIPQGKFRYLRAPMGLCSSNDEHCSRTDKAFAGLPWMKKLIDDCLLSAPSLDILFERLAILCKRAQEHQITFNAKKIQVGTEVKFAGFLVSQQGVSPDPEKVAALTDFPVPENVSQLRSFLGMCNQLAHFVPDLAQMSAPLRLLLRKNVAFTWLPEQQDSFDMVRQALSSGLSISHFDPSATTRLCCDASKLGLGFALLQTHPKTGKNSFVMCGSRSLSDAESRYAPIELEALAIQWSTRKCSYYLQGLQHYEVLSDHAPLRGVFSKSIQDVQNPRLQRFREALIGYNFTIKHIPGKDNLIADCLSRSPVSAPEDDPELVVCKALSDPAFDALFAAAAADPAYKAVADAVRVGTRPPDLPPDHPARPYSSVWDSLSLHNGKDGKVLIVLDTTRIVVPASERPRILRELHTSHSGLVKTKKLASQYYYWPHLPRQIEQMINACEHCHKFLPSLPKETMADCMATGPMSDVAIDIFEYGSLHYLIMVCRFSGYPFVAKLKNMTTAECISHLEGWMLDYGFPLRLRHDGAPSFRDSFHSWCHKNNIIPELSSAYYPASNALSEVHVKSMKHLLAKTIASHEDYHKAISAFRAAPRADGVSPNQLFFGRNLRNPALPALPQHLDFDQALLRRQEAKEHDVQAYDEHARDLPVLSVGDEVSIQNRSTLRWDTPGKVVAIRDNKRSYIVENLITGNNVLRNRRFLRPSPVSSDRTSDASDEQSHSTQSRPILRRSQRLADKKKKTVTFSI